MFVLEDEFHAEVQGEYPDLPSALAELKRRATLPWDEAPNRCPCTSWKTCQRRYEVIEYDESVKPWKELSRKGYLEISSAGVKWL
jgi:hypothetical protein